MLKKAFKNDIEMTQGPLFRKIVLFSLPLMLSGVLQLLYGVADMVVVGQYVGNTALAAVGSTGSLTNLIVGLFMGLSVGACVTVSHAIGAGKTDEVSETVVTSITMAMILGTVVGIFGIFTARLWLVLMGSPPEVIDQSTLYMRIVFAGMPAQMTYNYGSAILRAKGDTRAPLVFLSIAGIVNFGLNLLLVLVFHMGVAGVAVATVTSQVISATLVVWYLTKLNDCCRLDIKHLRINRERMIKILKIGLPAGIQGCLFSASNVLIQSSINSFGKLAMAGTTASQNIDGFIYIVMNALYHAALTFTGQNMGARKMKRVTISALDCLAIVSVIGIAMGVVTYIFKTPLLGIFIHGEAAEVEEAMKYANIRMLYLALPYFLCGLMEVGSGCLRGIGASVTSMIISLTGACVFRIIWIYTVFAAYPTYEILYLSYPISWFLTFCAHFTFFLIRKRKIEKRLLAEDAAQTFPTD